MSQSLYRVTLPGIFGFLVAMHQKQVPIIWQIKQHVLRKCTMRKILFGLTVVAVVMLGLSIIPPTSANHLDTPADGKVERCYAKLHSCFPGGDLKTLFPTIPSLRDCEITCIFKSPLFTPNPSACVQVECIDRCAVAFEIRPPPCK